jgi:hypothetical protein
MTILAQEVVDRVKRTFGDESGAQLTESDIFHWINDAQREVVIQNESLLEKITTIDVVENQDEYAYPDDLLVPRSIRFKDNDMESYARLEHRNLQEFDTFVNGWDGTYYGARRPMIYTVYGETFFLFPRPAHSTIDGLKLLYSRKPLPIDSGMTPLDLPTLYFNAVVKYVLAKAYEMDEDYESSTFQQTFFDNDVNTLRNREKIGNQEFYASISPRWDDML